MLKAIKSFFEKQEDRRNPTIDTLYEKLADTLTQYRQATAQAIATEQQLEKQAEKNLARAEEWKNRYDNASNEDFRSQALMRMQQYRMAYKELTVQIGAQKAAANDLLDRLGPLERPVQATWFLKTFLSVFPEPSKTPASLNTQLKELFDLIRELMIEQPSTPPSTKDWKPYYSKILDLTDRTAKAFNIFATYYRANPEDPEAGPFKKRAADFWWNLNEKAEKLRNSVAIFSQRLKQAEDAGNDEVAQKALARTIELGFFIPYYEKAIEALATAFDEPMIYDPDFASKSSEKSDATKKPNPSRPAKAHPSWKKKKRKR